MSDTLRNPAGGLRLGRLGAIDPAALAKAEAALKSLSSNFGQWMANELEKLDSAWAAARAPGPTPESIEALYTRAHDLKGLGTTYGFPIVTQIAGAFCRLIDTPEKRHAPPMRAIEAHVSAIKSAVADNITSPDDPAGQALLASLGVKVGA